jgi:hypothetical protein
MFWKKLDIPVADSNMQYLIVCPISKIAARKQLGSAALGL